MMHSNMNVTIVLCFVFNRLYYFNEFLRQTMFNKTNEQSFELDLRLFNRDIMRRALPVLVAILERETRGWFLHFRERLISELRSQKLPDEEIERVSVLYIFVINLLCVRNSTFFCSKVILITKPFCVCAAALNFGRPCITY